MENIKRVLIALSLLCFAAAGAEGGYLVSVGGAVYGEEGTLKTLGEFEYAFVSPDGAYYAVLTFEESSSFPLRSTARMYDKTGRLSYTVPNTGASRAIVADTGACVLVTMTAPEPTATAELAFYDASGRKTGSAEAGFPGDAVFSPGAEYVAIVSAGDATYVFDTDGGDLLYELPVSRTLVAGDDGLILLVDPEFIALYRDGFSEWEFDHDLYYPRTVQLNHDNTAALAGCHHEVALLDLETGRITDVWEAPEGFAVTDIAASDDFSLIAVGARSLGGIEAVYLLDSTFETLKSEKKTVAKPSGATPVVTVAEGEHPEALAFGQGWRTTLEK